MRGFVLVFLLFVGISVSAQHSNEFYIKGAHVTIQSGATLHVQGDVHLDEGTSSEKGRFNNDGVLELRGDFYVRDDNVEQTGTAALLAGTSTGLVRFKNRGFDTDGLGPLGETTHADENQRINTLGATNITGDRAFYEIELENDNSSLASVTDNFVDMDGGNVEVKNELTFNIDTRLRTDKDISPGTPPTGADYAYEIIVSNTDVDAIVGESSTAGDNNRYIEGKMAWQVSGTGDYYFPIGLNPGFSGSDGMEAFELRTTTAATQYINTYLSSGQTDLGVPQIYCDIGEYPNALTGTQPWSACIGGPDGLTDFAHLDVDQSHEWLVTSTGTDFTYDIEVYPGAGQNATVSGASGNCGGTGFYLRFLAKNGSLIEGGDTAIVISPPPPFGSTGNFPIGFDLCPPATQVQSNLLTGLSGFSRFRLHAANNSETALPIELVVLEANPIDNEYIEVFWMTASEINNEGFDLERSMDGINFEKIAWIEGNGTSLDPHSYRFDDRNVVRNITYYYRLKQIDLNGSFEYSYIVDARITGEEGGMVLYPNPVMENNPVLEINTLSGFKANVLILNAIGQEVKREVLNFHSGFNQIEVPTDQMAAGTYIVNVFWENQQFSEKLIVLKNK